MPSAIRFGFQAINADFAREINLEKRYFDQMDTYFPSGVDRLTEDWNGLCSGLFNFALETFEKTAASFEVEPRFPFFDRRLIEFCLSLPAKQKLLGGWTRSILRRAMGGLLPPMVQWRSDKANIGLSFKLNLIKYGRSDIESAIFSTPSRLVRFFDREKLIAAYRRYESDPLKYNGEPMLIMSSVYLSNWLRNSFESNPA
jgi:asparagine synthase (glutamine-hydrolysing)